MLKNEKKNFLFSMMWLYPVLFSINFRLQKCNLFACTPRMNNSRLSKHTRQGFYQQASNKSRRSKQQNLNLAFQKNDQQRNEHDKQTDSNNARILPPAPSIIMAGNSQGNTSGLSNQVIQAPPFAPGKLG